MKSPLAHSYQQTRSSAPSERALVYLVATHHEGFAFVVPPASRRNDMDIRSRTMFFPHLTSQTVEEWFVRRNDAGQVIGGFQPALDNAGIWLLEEWIYRERTTELEKKLALPLRDVANALPKAMDTLHQALCWMVESWQAEADILSGEGVHQHEAAKVLRGRLALPLGRLLAQGILEVELGWFLHEAELEVLLPKLSDVIMAPLRQWLDNLQLDNPAQPITFIPQDRLGWLPLQDALVPDIHTSKKLPFHETCKLTYKKNDCPLLRRTVSTGDSDG